MVAPTAKENKAFTGVAGLSDGEIEIYHNIGRGRIIFH